MWYKSEMRPNEALSEKLAASHEARIGPGPQARGPDGFYVAAFRKSS